MTPTIRRIAIDPAIHLSRQQISRLQSRFQVINGWPMGQAVEGLLVHTRMSESQIRAISDLRWIAVRAKNVDYVPELPEIKRIGIESLGATAVSEHVFSLILGICKGTVAGATNVREGLWRCELPLNRELAGKTLGIIGYGEIGKRVAKLGTAFGMEISSVTRSTGSLQETLRKSDFVSLHVSGPESHSLIGSTEISLMKSTAILVNSSRGSVIDQKALLEALDRKEIAGAALDVFEDEPLPACHPLGSHPRVLCSPHVGYMTVETIESMNHALVNAVMREVT